MGIDAINTHNFFMMPPVDGLERVGQGGGSRRTQGINGVNGHPTAGYNPFAEISKIDGELHPNLGDSGTHHVNGMGGGVHTRSFIC